VAAICARGDLIAALLRLPFLDADQAAVVAATSASTIRRACQTSGGLAHVRMNGGKLIRISPDALRAWLGAQTADAPRV
jgi:hypothetical protein